MTVRLHIDRLVVDAAVGLDTADAPLLGEAIRAELARLLQEAEPGWTSLNAWRVEGPGFARPAAASAEALGTNIAGALHACLRPGQGEPIP